jgi:glycosyltransferase involved in cell wall biosynthesis
MNPAPTMALPKVSVAMVTYNHEKFIVQAIESVLMQETSFPIELVIGEDCSKDGTREIVRRYAALRPDVIRPIFHERNVGMHKNGEAVMGACRGDYIAFLEGDDYWIAPAKLQRQVEMMEANPEYSMCGTATRKVQVSSDGTETEIPGTMGPRVIKSQYRIEDWLGETVMHTSTVLLRRRLVRYPKWIHQLEMGDLCLFALQVERGPAGYLNEATSVYRGHGGGVWTSKSDFERWKGVSKASDYLNSHFGGRYVQLLRRWEFGYADGVYNSMLSREAHLEAAAFYCQIAPRFIGHVPTIPLLGKGTEICRRLVVRRLSSVISIWHRLTMFLALRTRLRRLIAWIPVLLESVRHLTKS